MSGGFAMGGSGMGLSSFQLIGYNGWLQVDDKLFNPGHTTICSKGNPPVSLTEPLAAERYRWEIEEVCRCIRSGEIENPLVPHHLTVQAMQINDRARFAANLDPSI